MNVKRSKFFVMVALTLLLALATSAAYARDSIQVLDNHDSGSSTSSDTSAPTEGSVSPAGTTGNRYSDTGASTANCSSTWECGNRGSIVRNGDFNPALWNANGGPAFWNLSFPGKAGWVSHPANMNMAIIHDTASNPGENDALAMFIRNTGGAGPHYAHASQQLQVPVTGYYWLQAHASMFGDFVGSGADGHHNATAWYGIGSSDNPNSVTHWREMFPMDLPNPGMRPCYNTGEHCTQVGRYETIHLEAGDVLHLRAGHKWSTFNVWTVFEFDDISIVPLPETTTKDQSGYWDVGDVSWNNKAGR